MKFDGIDGGSADGRWMEEEEEREEGQPTSSKQCARLSHEVTLGLARLPEIVSDGYWW